MENSEIIKVILTSSVIAAILSVIVSAFVSLKLKHLDYRNEYYKKILEKRLEAYKYVETQIAVLKGAVLDKDGRPYHQMFSYGEDDFHKFQGNLIVAMAYSMWINEETTNEMENLNEIFFKISNKTNNSSPDEMVEFGKQNYNAISTARKKLEHNVRQDLLNLHDLKRFMKKKTSNKMREITLD